MNKFILFLFILATLVSCTEQTNEKSGITIYLQPFTDINAKETMLVYEQIKKVYPNTILNKPIPIPVTSWYAPRNRYRADSIIHYLSTITKKESVTIGITNKDISTTKNNITDFGIIGLGYQPGNACVISTYRLSKDSLSAQLYKVALHELGHTQGLTHCDVKTCLMRDAKGKNPLNEEKGFCANCKAVLQKKGWLF